MTAPRTVRTYCPKTLMPSATTSTASVLMASSRLPNTDLATPLTSSAIRMAGRVGCTFAAPDLRPSTAPPAQPAGSPNGAATDPADNTPSAPTNHQNPHAQENRP